MKAITRIVTNIQEIDEAEKLGIEVPEPIIRNEHLYFKKENIDWFFQVTKTEVNISICMEVFTIEVSKEQLTELRNSM